MDLYQYASAGALANYLAASYTSQLSAKLSLASIARAATSMPVATKPRRFRFVTQERREIREPIAIVGMSGMFPGAGNLEEFWLRLWNGEDLIREIPGERFEWRRYYGDPRRPGNYMDSKWGGFMEEVDRFDAAFFGISPREAEYMDPQQRLFLQTAWRTIEHAGYAPGRLAGTKTGVFVGVATNDYAELLGKQNEDIEAHMSTGGAHCLLPNRISYLLNLLGPSEPVDTACSSSLVAVHRAVQAIEAGDCELAVAGGVNVLLSPSPFIAFSKAGMLSKQGQCRAFGAGADGYVRGEGCAAVLLKRLSQAEADGDTIWGLIRGTAVNHGGRARSLTAPNPKAQAELLVRAWERAGAGLETVGYIEAHGTGTALGDPIEVEGLKLAFAELARQRRVEVGAGSCGLGSVKSNIGHLETAAGIAGLIKVLLAMRHQTLPASLHCQELNPELRLEGSPFYIVRERQAWEAKRGVSGEVLPRRAGVSSFGFGGVNAHIVVEEYQQAERGDGEEAERPSLMVLSARNEGRLKEYAASLRNWAEREGARFRLEDVAYTLQSGRDAMPQRLAFIAASRQDFIHILTRYCEGNSEAVMSGRSHALHDLLGSGPDAHVYFRSQVKAGNWSRLGRLWVEGIDVPWQDISSGRDLKRLPLPSYPFAEERHWFAARTLPQTSSKAAGLHPLVDANESTFAQQVFRKQFDGAEAWLTDHVIHGHPILPAVASLEMARVAAAHSTPRSVRGLRKVVWARPLVHAGQPLELMIDLQVKENAIDFQIRTGSGDAAVVHTQGSAYFDAARTGAARRLDLPALRERCNIEASTQQAVYRRFQQAGLVYGPVFQVVEELLCGPNEALTRLRLPAELEGGRDAFVLHPSILDGALQTAAGVSLPDTSVGYLPFALDEIEWHAPFTSACYAHARLLESNGHLRRFFITIASEDGTVLAELRDFAVRVIRAHTAVQDSTLYFEPVWHREDASSTRADKPLLLIGTSELAGTVRAAHSGVSAGPFPSCNAQAFKDLLRSGRFPAQLVWFPPQSPESVGTQNLCAAQLEDLLALCQSIVALRLNQDIDVLCVCEQVTEASPLSAAAIAAFGRSVSLEHPRVHFRAVSFEGAAGPAALLREIGQSEPEVRLTKDGRFIRRLQRARTDPISTPVPRGAVCLITGGAGALGLLTASHLIERCNARIVVSGRRPPELVEPVLTGLKQMGAEVIYLQADIAELDEATSLIHSAKSLFGRIDCVFHCAGLIEDSLVLKKTPRSMRRVLAPKISGTVNLDLATRDEPLTLFVMYSSLVGATGNAGQADYAAANAFLNEFSTCRDRLREKDERSGRTIAIGWPLWKAGGMSIRPEFVAFMEKSTGLTPLETDAGLRALDQCLGVSGAVVIASGDRARVLKSLGVQEASTDVAPESGAVALRNALLQLAAEVL
jgi:polyketide synthase PksN